MKLPSNMTEQQVLDAINKTVNIIAGSFKFGYFDVDDMKQQARLFALQALDKYDESRPLENFLYTHIKNRLINFKRDKYKRNDPPCRLCHEIIPGEQTAHPDGQRCARYLAWEKRNMSKQKIMAPLDITNISDENERTTRVPSNVTLDAEINEALELIDRHLSVEFRMYLNQMRSGVSIPKAKRLEVEAAVREILGDV